MTFNADLPEYEMEDDVEPNEGDSGHEYESDNSSDESDSMTDAEQEMENTVTRKKKTKRGLTRLPKLRTAYTSSGGRKRKVTFDELGRFSGKYRSEFPSFLGDLVREKVGVSELSWKKVTNEVKEKLWEEITRYYDIEECRRKLVMNRLGNLLRNFRRKLYANHIVPAIGKPTKLAKIPRQYRTIILNQEHWDKFVRHTQSDKFKDMSNNTKIARSNSHYQHRMGRGGYAGLTEKLIKDKVIEKGKLPDRSFMWRKGRENKNGELVDDAVKVIADKIIDHEKQINDGGLKLDPGTDALTLVFGKEHGGFLKGVGTGVTSTRYWHLPRTKGSSKQVIADLNFQLQNERHEHAKKDEQLKELSSQVTKQNNTLNMVLAHLASQGMALPELTSPTNEMSPKQVILADSNVGSKDTPNVNTSKVLQKEDVTSEFVQTTKKAAGLKNSTTNPTMPLNNDPQPKAMKCTLSYPDIRNIVARGTIYLSSEKQSIHGVPLQDDCYKVSVDEVIKAASFLPIETSVHKTVGDAHKSFVGWPKFLVKCDLKEPHTKSNQKNEVQNPKKWKQFTTLQGIVKTRSNMNKINSKNI